MGGGEECPASGLFPSAPAGEVPANLIAANVATKQLALVYLTVVPEAKDFSWHGCRCFWLKEN